MKFDAVAEVLREGCAEGCGCSSGKIVMGRGEGPDAQAVAAAPSSGGWIGSKPTHREIWGRGKPIVITKTGARAWTVSVMGSAVVDAAGGKGLTFKGRQGFVDGAPAHVFHNRSDADHVAHMIGRYLLDLGDFTYTYVEHVDGRDAPAPAAQAPLVASAPSPGPSECRPYFKIEKDERKFQACMKIADAIGPIGTPKKAYAVLREAAGHEVAERFGVMTLDTHLRLRGLWETGAGETDSVQAPRVPTLQAAVADAAATAVIYHVHPAASDGPSEADVAVTRQFARAFSEIGIPLMDHVIVSVGSRHGYYSFAESMPKALDPTR